jgi:hypothetical protein
MRMLSMLALVTLFSCANAIPIVKVFAVENNQPPAPKPVLSDVQEMGTTRCGKQGSPTLLLTKAPVPKREEMTVLSDVQEMGTTRCGKQGLPGPLSTKPPAPKREEMTVLSDVENIAIAAAHSTKLR